MRIRVNTPLIEFECTVGVLLIVIGLLGASICETVRLIQYLTR